MVHFTRQRDWATGGPDIWFTTTLHLCTMVFLDEMNVYIGRLRKQIALPIGWASTNQVKVAKRLTSPK